MHRERVKCGLIVVKATAKLKTRENKWGREKKRTHAYDVFGASLGCEHAENAGTASNIKDSFVLEKVGIVDDGVSVGPGSDRVLEHLFVDTCASGYMMRHRTWKIVCDGNVPKCAYESA